ncbi:MAG: hypothetical protein ACKN89_01675 [Cyanobium sp.]|jgi:hypothetical protein|nr:hypothetical protein [Synechococcaceae cyanobacterium]
MLDVPTLDALDLMLWLQSGVEAARVSDCVPSTIVRRVEQALKTFDLKLRRSRAGWSVRGNLQLISLEREIHQIHRFLGGGRLRLHLPRWTQQLLSEELPPQWLCPITTELTPCGDPLGLLRQRVIDACVLTPSQWPGDELGDADLLSIELFSSNILLYGNSSDPAQPIPSDVLEACRQGRAHLQVPDFLPLPCQEVVRERLYSLAGSEQEAVPTAAVRRSQTLDVTFLTPEMATLMPQLRPLAQPFEWRYTERLVVLREHADRPAIRELRQQLQKCLPAAGLPAPSLS